MTEIVHIGGVRYSSFDEGPGQRTVMWFAGCPLACKGCQTSQLWPADSGEPLELEEVVRRLLAGRQYGDHGVTFMGGEPFFQAHALAALCTRVRQEWPPTPCIPLIIIYTGYTYEALRARADAEAALAAANVLVDGPFVGALAEDSLGYRGSRNQRVIDLPRTLSDGHVVILDWDRPRFTFTQGRIVASPALARLAGFSGQPGRHCGELAA